MLFRSIAVYLIQEQDTALEAHSYVNELKEEDSSFEKQVKELEEKYSIRKADRKKAE